MIPATRKEALSGGYKRYFTGSPCLQGHVAERRAKTGECLSCRAEHLKSWREQNPGKVKQHNALQYEKHADKIKENVRKWGKKNPVKVFANSRANYSKRRMRLPKWLTPDDRWMIEQAYELAALRSKMFGFSWHVDHVLPLQGKLVSGLHTPYNLQVIPWVDNVRKANKFEAVT